MTRITGWQAVLWLIVAGVALVVLAVVLFWLALVVAALGLVLWLHLVVLPRLAYRLHVRRVVLDVMLWVALLGGGWLIDGPAGAALGGGVWLVGVGLPRLVGARVRRRFQTRTLVIDG